MSRLSRRVSQVGRWLAHAYALDLDFDPGDFVIPPEAARQALPDDEPQPRSGLVTVEEEGELHVGLYLDPLDEDDPGTLVEETSHLVCLGWHAGRELPVSRLALEVQAEVDRFLFARDRGADPLAHFERFRWAGWLDDDSRERYRAAHEAAHRYCRGLAARFPERRHAGALLSELRRFYRASPQSKLCDTRH